jgi:hypothetical protein
MKKNNASPVYYSGAGDAKLAPLGVESDPSSLMPTPNTDALAADMLKLFQEASAYCMPYRKEMSDAYWAARGEYSPEARCAIKDPTEQKFYAGLFSRQLSTYLAWVLDRIGSTDRFFTLTPTPVPAVPARYATKAVNRVLTELKRLSYLPTDVALEYAKERLIDIKAAINDTLYRDSQRAVKGMERVMDDVLEEGDFRRAYIEFHQDLFTSIGIMKFPEVDVTKRLEWSGDQMTAKESPVLRFRRVSPFDFYWSPDSTNAQDGRYIIERMRLPVSSLAWMEENSVSAITGSIQYLRANRSKLTDWVSHISGSANEMERAAGGTVETVSSSFVPGAVDVLVFHTHLDGAQLKKYGVKSYKTNKVTKTVEEEQIYPVEVWVAHGYTVYLAVNPHPLGLRPYQVASYDPIPGQLYGTSAWKKLAPYEIAFRSGHRALLRAVAFEAGVSAEVEASRFADGKVPADISPWSIYHVTSDYSGSGQRAINFLRPPNNTVSLRQYLGEIEQQAQHATGIYNTMAGAASYGTAGRTRFGVESIQSNATKIIFAKAEVIDKYAVEPILQGLYAHLMMFHEDETVKADAQVALRGLTSVADRSASIQNAIQLLQYLPAMLQIDQATGAQSVPPQVVQTLFRVIVESLGGNTDNIPDPSVISNVAQAIGLDPPGDFEDTRAAIQQELPATQIRIQPQAPAVGA